MIGSTFAPVVIAIVVSIALAVWISAVYYANAHPRHRPKRDIKTEVAGGALTTNAVRLRTERSSTSVTIKRW